MNVLTDLLRFADDNPRPIIVSLVGVIAVGTIAGGLWIKTLTSALDEAKQLSEERLALIEERYTTGLAALQSRNAVLEARLSKLEKLAKQLAALPEEVKDSSVRDELISNIARDAQDAIDESEKLQQLANQLAREQLEPTITTAPSQVSYMQLSLIFPFVLLLFFILGIGNWLIRKWK